MKKISLLLSLAFLLASLSTHLMAQTENSIWASVGPPALGTNPREVPTITTTKVSNEKEVLLQITEYLKKNLRIPVELSNYYNGSIKVTASFHISKNGTLENICVTENCKDPLISAAIHQLTKLAQVSPVVENGVAVSRSYFIPILLKKP